ncbi:uncharacterized protein LOC114341339 [Diabrotica virgifera virgifera]|uniref:Uncharacterized protein LOC114341339 n=1 Tax=Diabrotica virgifera virgifera TaxID=50390 RepID=A0A6P7GED0_DIAVI|nr:uncharacterized protein LOC114341339 [Diabrotica virgifera virgifera]
MRSGVMLIFHIKRVISVTVLLVVGRYIKHITSRKLFGKILIKLPSCFFVTYRIVVNEQIIEFNRKVRQLVGFDYINNTSDHTSDDDDFEESAVLRPRTDILQQFDEEVIYKPSSTPEKTESIPKLSPVTNYIHGWQMKKAQICLEESIHEPQTRNCVSSQRLQLIVTPPLRRITTDDLNSVRLKRPALVSDAVIPTTNDLLAVLRRRFAAMHDSYNSESESDIADEMNNSEYFNIDVKECTEIACL